jgi:hypothetical protein
MEVTGTRYGWLPLKGYEDKYPYLPRLYHRRSYSNIPGRRRPKPIRDTVHTGNVNCSSIQSQPFQSAWDMSKGSSIIYTRKRMTVRCYYCINVLVDIDHRSRGKIYHGVVIDMSFRIPGIDEQHLTTPIAWIIHHRSLGPLFGCWRHEAFWKIHPFQDTSIMILTIIII